MSHTLLWCWKEWRSQRALLGSYAFLVFASLCCGFLLVSEEFWQHTGGAHVLGWFVAAGVIGVVAFAVPQLVRSEFGAKDDTFVRRLPGALRPSFQGKLLFLLLVSAAFPVIGLASGELFVTASGHSWNELFTETGNAWAESRLEWPGILICAAWSMVCVPWVWVLGTWLPGGRMAIGATTLLSLLLGLGVFAVMRNCPGLETTLASSWQPWAYGSVPFGLLIAGMSWVRGRRGGGNYRSARAGLPWFAMGLLAPALWLGSWAFEYHHPDLGHLAFVQVEGMSSDGRFVIGRGSARDGWFGVPLRIDLETGQAEQLGGIATGFSSSLTRPFFNWPGNRQRFWQVYDCETDRHEVLDIDNGKRWPVDFDDQARSVILSGSLRQVVGEDRRAQWPFRTPGGRANVDDGELLLEQPGGSIRHESCPPSWRDASLRAAGHGIVVWTRSGRQLYDLTRLQMVTPTGITEPDGWAVRGVWILHVGGAQWEWRRFDSERSTVEPCPELKGCELLGLFDDDRLLCQRRKKNATDLFLYRPAGRTVVELELPTSPSRWQVFYMSPYTNSPGCVDRFGRIWLYDARSSPSQQIGCAHVDPTTLAIDLRVLPLRWQWGTSDMLDCLDEHSLLVREGGRILRVDMTSSERTVLFPRGR